MTCSTCYRLHAHDVKRGRGTMFSQILGFLTRLGRDRQVTSVEAGLWTCSLYTGAGTLVLDMTHSWEC